MPEFLMKIHLLTKLILIFVFITISGCVGVAYYPFSSKKDINEIKGLEVPYLGIGGKLVVSSKDHCSPYVREGSLSFNSKEDLLKYWGKPSRIVKNGNIERFTYYGSFGLSGVYILVTLIPIPLLVPFQRSQCIVELNDGIIKRLEKIKPADYWSSGCSLLSEKKICASTITADHSEF